MRSLAASLALGALPLPGVAGATATSVFTPRAAVGLAFWCYHDGACVAPRLRSVACPAETYELGAHRIMSSDRFDEREIDLDEAAVASTTLRSAGAVQWLGFDLGGVVRAWHGGTIPSEGVAVKLAHEPEADDAGGQNLPSSSFADAAATPRLVVVHAAP